MIETGHTIASLLQATSDEEIFEALQNTHDQNPSNYAEVITKLRNMTPDSSEMMDCWLERVDDDDDPPSYWINVHGKKKGDETTWAIEYCPWKEWLAMNVIFEDGCNLSNGEALANILYEMTWAGFDEDEVQKQHNEIMESLEEVTKQIEK